MNKLKMINKIETSLQYVTGLLFFCSVFYVVHFMRTFELEIENNSELVLVPISFVVMSYIVFAFTKSKNYIELMMGTVSTLVMVSLICIFSEMFDPTNITMSLLTIVVEFIGVYMILFILLKLIKILVEIFELDEVKKWLDRSG